MSSKPYNREDNIEPLDPEFSKEPYTPTLEEINYDTKGGQDTYMERYYKLGYWRATQNEHRILGT